MNARPLGTSGLTVSAIGLGCMPMSGIYGTASEEDGIATIRRAIDVGITLLDTADIYGDGHNEELVGRAIQGRRDEVIVATKFGNVLGSSPRRISGRPEYVRQACEASLRRLGIDTIDLYQQHRVDPDTPIEETMGALAELVDEGKVRYAGLSEALPPDIRRAAGRQPIASLQNEYSLVERSVEREVLGVCEDLGIGFLAFSPLSRGLLGGTLTPDRRLDAGDARGRAGRFPRVGPDHLAANAALAHEVQRVADGHGATPAQVALAWLLSRRPWIVPIPGAKRIAHVEDNAGAAELRLDAEAEAQLDVLADRVQGERYGSEAMTPDWVSPAVAD